MLGRKVISLIEKVLLLINRKTSTITEKLGRALKKLVHKRRPKWPQNKKYIRSTKTVK